MLLSRVAQGLLGSSLAIMLGLAGTAAAYAAPGSCTGFCFAHDPAVIRRSDGTYFRFSTGGGIGIATAASLGGPWTYKGVALNGGSKLLSVSGNSGSDLWAPHVIQDGSTYYMYYAVSSFGSKNSAIGYATSPTMDVGSWTDHGSTGVRSDGSVKYNAIDPTVFKDGGGYRMSFGSFFAGLQTVAMAGPTRASGGVSTIAYSADHGIEGSFIHENGGYYYLFFSAGQCCGYQNSKPAPGREYSIRVCRSTSSSGGFVDKAGTACTAGGGTIVLASHDRVYGPGGQGIVGGTLYYHYADTTVGIADKDYKFGYNSISWAGGWPTV